MSENQEPHWLDGFEFTRNSMEWIDEIREFYVSPSDCRDMEKLMQKYRRLCNEMLDWMREEGHQRAFDDFGKDFEEIKPLPKETPAKAFSDL